MGARKLNEIMKHYGWEKCEHGHTMRYCEKCKYDIPTFMRTGKYAKRYTLAKYKAAK
jgi:hypothetical protein